MATWMTRWTTRCHVDGRVPAGGATYVVHELLAHGADLLGQRGAEHHDLLVVGGHLEDLLHVAAHV
jgi:hypothetical protein